MSVTHITVDGKKYDRRAQYDAFFVVSDWDAGTQTYTWGGVAKRNRNMRMIGRLALDSETKSFRYSRVTYIESHYTDGYIDTRIEAPCEPAIIGQ